MNGVWKEGRKPRVGLCVSSGLTVTAFFIEHLRALAKYLR